MLLRIEEIGDDANFTKKQFNKYSQHYIGLQMKNITLVNNEIIFFKSFLTTFIYLVIAVSLAVLRQNYTNTLFVKGSKYQYNLKCSLKVFQAQFGSWVIKISYLISYVLYDKYIFILNNITLIFDY